MFARDGAATAPIPRHDRRARAADLFDAWLLAEAEATLALAAWRSAPSDSKADAHGTYLAALDREAKAAEVLALRVAA